MNAKIIISLEGNIGVGKSTLMGVLEKDFSDIADFVYEPVDEWLNILDENEEKNLLDIFYEDKKRWAYTFQNVAYVTRMKRILDTTKNVIIMDRSLDGDYNTFTKMLREEGCLNDIEWQSYLMWYNLYRDYIGKNVQKSYVYLRCSPEVAIARIAKRNRSEEKSISIDYINKLHDSHEKWFEKEDNVYTFNVEEDFINDESKLNKLKSWIKTLII